jgi:hypothetical protein
MHEHLPDLLGREILQCLADLLLGELVVPNPERRRGVFARGLGKGLPDVLRIRRPQQRGRKGEQSDNDK